MTLIGPRAVLATALLYAATLVPSMSLAGRNSPTFVPLSLEATLPPLGVHDVGSGDVPIAGHVPDPSVSNVRIRVTTSWGEESLLVRALQKGAFRCLYPKDFPGAPDLRPCLLFVDAVPSSPCSGDGTFQAEATVIVLDVASHELPEFPAGFTCDLIDARGRVDRGCSEWPVIRKLANLYLRSRAARLCGPGKPQFDLEREEDLALFKNSLSLFEFDYRDRDWSTPLGRRVRRTFWQAVWDTWFNASNNNPVDGDPGNRSPSNYVPYAFANDFCDTLILYLQRFDLRESLDDNLETICREGLENMIAMQHRGQSSFALQDAKGRTHTYTAGAFRYGMFEDGRFMTEGTGWFVNPEHADCIQGGVFNGRSLWAVGEGLKRFPTGELGESLRETLRMGIRFCLLDSLEHGYAKRTSSGLVYWYDPGEMGYLLLGMIAACEADPGLPIPVGPKGDAVPLTDLVAQGLDALVELAQPHGQWQIYANKDPMAIAALAEGVRALGNHSHRDSWRRAAVQCADAWLAARVDSSEYAAPLVHFGARRLTPDRMTFLWDWTEGDPGRPFIFFYISGHWIQALAALYDVTGDIRYRDRAGEIIRYLCGANPWHVRLLNELGGVYNWVEDTDGDGVEDQLRQDMYPESTAFCQIGIRRLMDAICRRARRGPG